MSGNVFFFKQKTAYEIVDCDWSSDVCSSDLVDGNFAGAIMCGADMHYGDYRYGCVSESVDAEESAVD